MTHLLATLAIGAIAASGSIRRKKWVMEVLILAVASSRLLRRLLDWQGGSFTRASILSVMPLLVAMTMAPVGLKRISCLSAGERQGLFALFALLVYALALGATNAFAAAHEFAGYIGLLSVFLYFRSLRIDPKVVDGWIRTLVWAGIAVAIYGWLQFLFVPPWDARWMIWSEMGSIGRPEPMNVRLFSTLASPGPAATFLAFALLPACVNKRWRTRLSWGAPMIILSAFLLTMVRTQWISFALMFIAWGILSTGKSRVKLALTLVFLGGLAFLAIPLLPGGERISGRLDTFADIGDDRSLEARAAFSQLALSQISSDPLGQGFGTAGSSVRLSSGEELTIVFDNGVLYFFSVFGWLGGTFSLLFVIGLCLRLRALAVRTKGSEVERFAMLAFVLFLGRAASLASGNSFENDVVLILAALIGVAFGLGNRHHNIKISNKAKPA